MCSELQNFQNIAFFVFVPTYIKILNKQQRTEFNPLNTKRRLLYLKTQFVPRSKHFSSRL